jgi:hypothetical protein
MLCRATSSARRIEKERVVRRAIVRDGMLMEQGYAGR